MLAAVAAALKSGAVFGRGLVACVAYVALSVSRLIPMEVAERLFSALRHRSCVAVMRIVAVIDVAVEAMRTMEPWAGSNENTASEPIGPVIAIGSAVIRGIVEIPVCAGRCHSNVNGNLSWCDGHTA